MSNPSPPGGAHFKRANIIVTDLDRALDVYRDILGFSIDYIKDSDEASYSYVVFEFPKEAKLRFCTLNLPGQERTLAITEVTGVDMPKVPRPGLNAMVINVDDFDGVVAKAQAAGLKVFPEGELKDLDGSLKGREIGFLDHDGHLVVLYHLND